MSRIVSRCRRSSPRCADKLGVITDVDVRCLSEGADQVVRHVVGEGATADQKGHPSGVGGEKACCLSRGVPAADDGDVLPGDRRRLRYGCAVEHARAMEPVQFGVVDLPIGHTRREDDRSAA